MTTTISISTLQNFGSFARQFSAEMEARDLQNQTDEDNEIAVEIDRETITDFTVFDAEAEAEIEAENEAEEEAKKDERNDILSERKSTVLFSSFDLSADDFYGK